MDMIPQTPESALTSIRNIIDNVARSHPAELGKFLDGVDTYLIEVANRGKFQVTPAGPSNPKVTGQSIPNR
jgi:hypothetical protein